MAYGNPMYNSVPATAPGLEGLRHTIGDMYASFTGGETRPYVAPNQGMYEAMMAKNINGPLYSMMMANTYGQMGRQVGNTLGAMGFVQRLAGQAGMSPSEVRDALSGGGDSLGRGFFGQMVMPMLDSAMNNIGLTGGSIVAASNAVYSNRMNLLSPGTLLSPTDAGQMHHVMGAASAVSSMLNGMLSKTTRDGNLTLLPNLNLTQGFNREKIADVVMRAAGRGMFNSYADVAGLDGEHFMTKGGLADRLSDAAGGMDLSLLDYTMGDFTGGGKDSVFTSKAAKKMQTLARDFGRRMKSVTEAMAAMRDLTNEVDGIEDKLDMLTNGNWLRSGHNAIAARDAIRTLHGIATVNNLNPQEALSNIMAMRGTLQDAAGFDQSMVSMGFDGGGMFGLPAQVELLANTEDMITARGIRGDPILSNRLRGQARQAMARNINTTAGRAAQILAFARQTGAVSEDEAEYIRGALETGDRGIMGAGINRLLTTVFGSADVGRQFMNDQMQMNSMRQAMDDKAGAYAIRTTIRGADAEFNKRSEFVAAKNRLEFSKQLMSEAGMRTWQSDEDAKRLVESVAQTIEEEGENSHESNVAAAEFRRQFNRHVKNGMTPLAALSATKKAFASNPLTAAYSSQIEKALVKQAASNNEYRLKEVGQDSYTASNTSKWMLEAGMLSSEEHLEISKLVQEGKGKDAMKRLNANIDKLSGASYELASTTADEYWSRYEKSKKTLEENKDAEEIIAKANYKGYGASQSAHAYLEVVSAAKDYFKGSKGKGPAAQAEAYMDFVERFSGSKFTSIFGEDEQKAVFDAIKKGDMSFFDDMGRRAAAIKRINVGNLRDNGYSLHMDGFWGEGKYAGNSDKARKDRDKLVGEIASQMVESAQLDTQDATPLAQDMVSMLLGDENWEQTLAMYDPSGKLKSKFSNFSRIFGKLEAAKGKALDISKSKEFRKAIRDIGEMEGGNAKVEHLMAQIKKGMNSEDDVARIQEFLLNEDIDPDSDAGKQVMGYAEALYKVSHLQEKSQKMIGKDISLGGKDLIDAFTPVNERKKRKASAGEKLLGDSELASFLKRLDLSDEGVDDAKGKLSDAFGSLRGFMNRDEAAKALGRKSGSELSTEEWMGTAMKAMQEKAGKGDAGAIEAMKAFKAASREGLQRITGEITIRNGNEQAPATLDGSVGGLQQ